jgi:uncharacterized protein (DUF2237 family)
MANQQDGARGMASSAPPPASNVLGGPLECCCTAPMTGAFFWCGGGVYKTQLCFVLCVFACVPIRLYQPNPSAPTPLEGYYRDGFCRTGGGDFGVHVVCAQVTPEFLAYTKARGNDLSTPFPPHFPGLRPGDKWCLCASRWQEALEVCFLSACF